MSENHRKYLKLNLLIIAAISLMLAISGCKKQPSESKDSSTLPPGQTAQEVQNPPQGNETVQTDQPDAIDQNDTEQKAEAPQDKAHYWMPGVIDLDIYKTLSPEEAEQKIILSFSEVNPPDSDEILSLKKKADEGDDEAAEKLALHYIHLPATDARHDQGLSYIKKLKTIQSAEALYYRGLAEFNDDGENVEKAKPFLKKSADMDYEPAIRYLNDNYIFDLHDEAWSKLSALCAKRNDKPETFLEFIKLQDFVPDDKAIAERAAYIDKGIEKNFPDAYYAKALMMMDTGKWQDGFEMLTKSAELGSSDGNAMVAGLLVAANGAKTAEDAYENTGLPLNDEQFQYLKKLLSEADDKVAMIDQYAIHAGGNVMACGILMGHASSDNETPQVAHARDGFIQCLKQFLSQHHSRSDCELAYGLTVYDDQTVSFSTIFSDEERLTIGHEILNCFNQALNDGDDYTDEGPTAASTALRISRIFGKKNDFEIEQDEGRELQYLIYAAAHHDPVAQSVLAQNYLAGKIVPENMKRACYWAELAINHNFCTEFCRESTDVTTCEICGDAKEVSAEACKATEK